jgi:hypothetical protein
MADAERRRQAQTQLDALEAFWSEWFRSEKGQFKAEFQNFPSTDAFEQQIELLLRQWLETRGLLGPRIASERYTLTNCLFKERGFTPENRVPMRTKVPQKCSTGSYPLPCAFTDKGVGKCQEESHGPSYCNSYCCREHDRQTLD